MALPLLRTAIPGPRSRALARQLHRYESRNITLISDHWPVFWERAAGANVWDVDGNRYLDLTAAFGVANVGHSNPRVVAAIRCQAGQLIHAMGDVHPNALKLALARELVALTFGRWLTSDGSPGGSPSNPRSGGRASRQAAARVIFANSGAEAVEAALKTAAIHTGRPGVIAFHGAYHGLTYGALAATARSHFRQPFEKQLGKFVTHIPFGQLPVVGRAVPARHGRSKFGRLGQPSLPQPLEYYGAVLVEPIQGRAGIIVPPNDFLPGLRRFCDRQGLVLIFDEIYTGFCRTGRWFAAEHWNVVPDVVCVGKGMAGGFPLAACVGRAAVMDSWPDSDGEAIHTSTFLGNPLGCAAALAAIAELKRLKLAERAAALGTYALQHFPTLRGRGLMLGLPVVNPAKLCEQLLQRGILALPEGDVLGLTPPLTITRRQLALAIATIVELDR